MVEDVPSDHPVVLFDGVCNLCAGYVQFLVRRDPDGIFRFAPLQSAVAETLLEARDVDGDELDSIVLIEDDDVYVKSSAVVRIAVHLGGVYRLLGPFRYVPERLRDFVYDVVAARRYDWFGRREACMIPTPELESRFLAGGSSSPSDD